MADKETLRKATSVIYDAVSEAISAIEENEEEVSSAVVSGFVLLVETAHEDGLRTFRILSGDAGGEMGLPFWTVQGWLNHASINYDIYDDEADDDDEEEDED